MTHLQNKRRAFQVLTARLMDRKLTQDLADRRAERRDLVKTADRSEKIRTYNYAQVCISIRWPSILAHYTHTPTSCRNESRITDWVYL